MRGAVYDECRAFRLFSMYTRSSERILVQGWDGRCEGFEDNNTSYPSNNVDLSIKALRDPNLWKERSLIKLRNTCETDSLWSV